VSHERAGSVDNSGKEFPVSIWARRDSIRKDKRLRVVDSCHQSSSRTPALCRPLEAQRPSRRCKYRAHVQPQLQGNRRTLHTDPLVSFSIPQEDASGAVVAERGGRHANCRCSGREGWADDNHRQSQTSHATKDQQALSVPLLTLDSTRMPFPRMTGVKRGTCGNWA
jgi:hypothetical protein